MKACGLIKTADLGGQAIIPFRGSKSGCNWYRIEMLMVQGDAEAQIAPFQFFDPGPTSLLEGKNDEKPCFFFFENDPTLRIYSSTPV